MSAIDKTMADLARSELEALRYRVASLEAQRAMLRNDVAVLRSENATLREELEAAHSSRQAWERNQAKVAQVRADIVSDLRKSRARGWGEIECADVLEEK